MKALSTRADGGRYSCKVGFWYFICGQTTFEFEPAPSPEHTCCDFAVLVFDLLTEELAAVFADVEDEEDISRDGLSVTKDCEIDSCNIVFV